MKTLVIYDSLFGNTEKVACAIGDGLAEGLAASGSVRVLPVGEVLADQLSGWDLLVVGGPTHGSHPSPPMREFLDRIPNGALTGVQVAAFDTRTDMETLTGALRLFGKFLNRLGYAAPKISSDLATKGGQVILPPEGFIVEDKEGPLRAGELERAVSWGRQIGHSSARP
jgi:flavodoxin